jgi:hypothetical protein
MAATQGLQISKTVPARRARKHTYKQYRPATDSCTAQGEISTSRRNASSRRFFGVRDWSSGPRRRSQPAAFSARVAHSVRLRRGSDRDQILLRVQNGGDLGRLFRLGIVLSDAQMLHLGRQIAESIDRERLSRTQVPDSGGAVDYVMPALSDDVATKVQLLYCADAADALRKALHEG